MSNRVVTTAEVVDGARPEAPPLAQRFGKVKCTCSRTAYERLASGMYCVTRSGLRVWVGGPRGCGAVMRIKCPFCSELHEVFI